MIQPYVSDCVGKFDSELSGLCYLPLEKKSDIATEV